MTQADWLRPQEPLAPRVGALMTTREGGVSAGAFASMNLGAYVGDDAGALAENQARLERAISARPVFMKQVHGTRVVQLHTGNVGELHEADACITVEPGIVCTVTVADCLPVLLSAPEGRAVAAAHAGWRGLAHGVVENTLHALCEAGSCEPADVRAWLGACIGPDAFQVGPDVLEAFGAAPTGADPQRFKPAASAGKWLANLPQLARDRLAAAGVSSVSGGGWCTFTDPARFYSFRRDRVTGRMAACIWLQR
jgi:YfiH family protein